MEKILENTLLLMILPWIFVWGILCILEKRKRKNEDGNKDEKAMLYKMIIYSFPFFVRYVFIFILPFLYGVFY